MKNKGNNNSSKLIIALIAVCCLSTACQKSDDKKNSETTKASETTATTVQSSEDTTVTTEDTSATTEDTSATTEETSASTEDTKATTEETSATSDETPAKDVTLGFGNITNDGLATGNSKYTFYTYHPTANTVTLVQEDNASGEKKDLYTTSSIDSMNLLGDALYFREESSAVTKLSLADGATKKIYNGQVTNLTAYGDHLYFSENSCLVRCGLDGSNKEELFKAEHSSMPADVAFSIVNDTIYFVNPTDFATGGSFFGKVFSMDLDGKNQKDFPSGVSASNGELFFTDGEWLFFYGSSEDQSVFGYLGCKLDGSDFRHINRYSPSSINSANGKLFLSTSDGLNVLDKDMNPTQIFDEKIGNSARFSIVGENIYFMDETNTATLRVSLDGKNKTVLH